MDLSAQLRDIYDDIRVKANLSIGKENPAKDVSDVLLTKVLMGTLGCVPAYDRFFCAAVKKCKVATGQYNANSVKQLGEFYLANQTALENFREQISQDGIEYPPMKIIDMCFWQVGFENDSD